MSNKIRWPDLSEFGIFLAFTHIDKIGEKLFIVDLYNRGKLENLEVANIKPVVWTPQHIEGIYYLDTQERKFKPSAIAKAFDINSGCTMAEKSKEQIIEEFIETYDQKTTMNVIKFRSDNKFVGKNHEGDYVYEYKGNRYLSQENKITQESQLKDKSFILSALDEEGNLNQKFMRKCLLVLASKILSGIRVDKSTIKDFGKIILRKKILSDLDIYNLQENLETSVYELFSAIGDIDEVDRTFDIAKKAYAAQPTRNIRTNDTMSLGQYSTPLQISFVAQYILNAVVESKNHISTLLEPCIGNSGLVSLLSNNEILNIKGFEIDSSRVNMFNNVDVTIADATKVDFKSAISDNHYDFIIGNPPFGKLEQKELFNGQVAIQRLDYLIALKALESRKDDGYSVFILRGDNFVSNGEIQGGSNYFYNYLYDNYKIDGLVELSSQMYKKNGANINVRMIAIGNKFDSNTNKNKNVIPQKIEIIDSDEKLINWAKQTVNKIKNPIATFNQKPFNQSKLSLTENVIEDLFSFNEDLPEIIEDNKSKTNYSSGVDNKIENKEKISSSLVTEKKQLQNTKEIKKSIIERHKNELQLPYQSASNVNEPSTMIPINLASGTYSALRKVQYFHPDIDQFVCEKLKYSSKEELGSFFSSEQIDALALAIFNHENFNRASLNADQTGIGKGRFIAGLMRYAKLNGMTPVFITYKPSLMADIFRDITDTNSREVFKNVFVINNTPIIDIFDPKKTLFKQMTYKKHKEILESGVLPEDTDLVLGTYSQFNKDPKRCIKANFLVNISENNPFYFLDESHNAAGESNTNTNLILALKYASGISFSSATALKNINSFKLYQSLFPTSIDTNSLSDVLKVGGESLQEAVSICMAEDGVLIRREHDLSNLNFRVVHSSPEEEERNRNISDQVSEILSMMTILSGEVSSEIKTLNKEFNSKFEEEDYKYTGPKSGKLQANSLNFASRLYNITRQFLLGMQIEQTINQSLVDLKNNIKPVIGVENTGESFVNRLINNKIFSSEDVLAYEILTGTLQTSLSKEQKSKLEKLEEFKAKALENFYFDDIPQFSEYLEIMAKKIRKVPVVNDYGVVKTQILDNENYRELESKILEKIHKLPKIPLVPIDYIRQKLKENGYSLGEVSGRNIYLEYKEIIDIDENNNKTIKKVWVPNQIPNNNVTKTIVDFQNGELDAIIITKAGSTGYSMHSNPRYKDTRQRDFISLQKATNIAEYLQWLGRVNRKGQVIEPIITNLTLGLPVELRLTMMHNAKLRKLSANVTSNRENNNIESKEVDFLNHIGDEIAYNYLMANRELAEKLNIPIISQDDTTSIVRDNHYINKLMSRLVLISNKEQSRIINDLSGLFSEKIDELDAQNINPFTVKVHDWKARTVKSYEYESFDSDNSDSSFDLPLVLTELEFNVKHQAITFEQTEEIVENYHKKFPNGLEFNHLISTETDSRTEKLDILATNINKRLKNRCFESLPQKLKDKVSTFFLIDNYVEQWRNKENMEKYVRMYDIADFSLQFSCFEVGNYLQVINDLNETKVARIVGYLLPEKHADLTHGGRLGLKLIIAGEAKSVTMNMIKLYETQKQLKEFRKPFILDIQNGSDLYKKQIEQASNINVLKRVRVMHNNLYKATEMASEHKLGIPILYNDSDGTRKRAILLSNDFSFEKLKQLPIKMNFENMMNYHNLYFNQKVNDNFEVPPSPLFVSRMTPTSRVRLDIAFESVDSENFEFIIKDVKSKYAKSLRADTFIFSSKSDIENSSNSLNLELIGRYDSMQCNVSIQQLPILIQRLKDKHGLNGLYLKEGSEELLESIRTASKTTNNEVNLDL